MWDTVSIEGLVVLQYLQTASTTCKALCIANVVTVACTYDAFHGVGVKLT